MELKLNCADFYLIIATAPTFNVYSHFANICSLQDGPISIKK